MFSGCCGMTEESVQRALAGIAKHYTAICWPSSRRRTHTDEAAFRPGPPPLDVAATDTKTVATMHSGPTHPRCGGMFLMLGTPVVDGLVRHTEIS